MILLLPNNPSPEAGNFHLADLPTIKLFKKIPLSASWKPKMKPKLYFDTSLAVIKCY